MELVLKRIKAILQKNLQYYLDIIFQEHLTEDTNDYGGGIYEKIPDEQIEYFIGETDIIPTGLLIQIIGNGFDGDSRGYQNETEQHNVSIIGTFCEDLVEKSSLRVKRYARACYEIIKDFTDLRDPDTGRDEISKGIPGKVRVLFYPAIPNETEKEGMNYLIKSFEINMKYEIPTVIFRKKYGYYNKNLI